MNTEFNVSNIVKTNVIPTKARFAKTASNPLNERLTQLAAKPAGHSFTIYGVKLREVHSRVYAAARKLGLHVTMRTLGDDVLVVSVDENGQIPSKNRVS